MSQASPYRLFDVRLHERIELTPSLVRMVFGGPDVAEMASHAPDQRIKVFFPAADGRPPAVPAGADWYARYRALDEAVRPPMRTYTIRGLRPRRGEVEVDFVLHGATGPASRWALDARPGDPVQLLAPHADGGAADGGFEWRPPAGLRQLLVVADETALPAVAGILEDVACWPRPPQVQAFLEVPHHQDAGYLPAGAAVGTQVHWLPRMDADGVHHARGERLLAAVRGAALEAQQAAAAQTLDAVDVDRDILWEQADAAGDFYAWIAGEAGIVMRIRRHLVDERRIAKRSITFMGYWREGRALD